ncbi:MAG: MBL fold metallo-hydrolase [Nocardioides sp.]|nr:MBL fold metallo-hydrolase [Nocardioides sp.]
MRNDLPAQAVYQSTGSGTWTEPGAYEVSPGVHRIPLPLPMDGLRAVNVYVLESDEGLTLVDGGWAIEESRTLLESSLKQIGYGVRDIRRFLVTHVHRDHYTQAAVIAKEFGAGLSLGIGDKPTLDLMHDPDLDHDPTVAQLERAGAQVIAEEWARVMHGDPPDLGLWGYPDTWLETDHTIEVAGRSLKAVSTPGHTQGHFVFADEAAGVLFAGDHVLPTITPSVGFEPVYAPQPLRDFMASLVKVRAMPDMTLLPAHGPTGMSSHQRVDELLAFHEGRLARCIEIVRGGARTAYEVAGELPWTKRERRLVDLDVFNGSLATMETLTHLELLALRGDLVRHDGPTVEFSAP